MINKLFYKAVKPTGRKWEVYSFNFLLDSIKKDFDDKTLTQSLQTSWNECS
jgi:hypothetical protein